jgi:hypothetical protein
MVILAHCTSKSTLKNILFDKKIKTYNSLYNLKNNDDPYTKNDVVYFTFFNSKYRNQFYFSKYCIGLKISNLIKKYPYYAMSSFDNNGHIDIRDSRLSSKLYKLVQKSNNIEEFKNYIYKDNNISEQAKNALTEKEHIIEIFNFKNIKNPTIGDIYKRPNSWTEIIFFEDIDITNLPFKIYKDPNR